MASNFRRMSGASSGRILPCALYQSQLQGNSCHLKRRPCFAPTASSTRTPSGITSRPMPSPGMTAIACSFMAEILSTIRSMRLAATETSSHWCSVALAVDGEIACLERRAPNRHSELALPMLENLLQKSRINIKDLDAIAFGSGPGAFTGLRIACGLTQGLALARGLPVIGVSAFEAIAEESGAPKVAVCIDARMQEIYHSALERRDGLWHEVVSGQCIAPRAAAAPPGEGWIGAGSGFAAYPDLLNNLGVRKPEIHATALAVARLAEPRLAAGQGVDAAQAVPVYLRDKVAFTKAELETR